MNDNTLAFADAASLGLPRHRDHSSIEGPAEGLAVTWVRVGPTVRAQEEVLLLAHINALRAAVVTFPAGCHLSKRRRQTVRKPDCLEMFLEQDAGSEWGRERVSKDWPFTPRRWSSSLGHGLDLGVQPACSRACAWLDTDRERRAERSLVIRQLNP